MCTLRFNTKSKAVKVDFSVSSRKGSDSTITEEIDENSEKGQSDHGQSNNKQIDNEQSDKELSYSEQSDNRQNDNEQSEKISNKTKNSIKNFITESDKR